MATMTTARLLFRALDTIEEMTAVEDLQKEIWGFSDREIVPAVHLRAVAEVGGVLLGAYDGDALVGFVYGFPGLRDGRLVMHSDMLGVRVGYRDQNIGYELKRLQRERALKAGIHAISWTFDALLSRNAHFNIAKLGAVVDGYRIDFYGAAAWGAGLSDSSDRLWVTWPLCSERVRLRLESNARPEVSKPPRPVEHLLECSADLMPRRVKRGDALESRQFLIEMPADTSVMQSDRGLLAAWRDATRWAFTEAFAAGCSVVDYCLIERPGGLAGAYVLEARG